MVFLQKKAKTHLKKAVDPEDGEKWSDDDFPKESDKIIFNMFDEFRNETIFVK